MTAPLDTDRAAPIVMLEHGPQARAHAQRRAAEFVQAYDSAGQANWLRVGAAHWA